MPHNTSIIFFSICFFFLLSVPCLSATNDTKSTYQVKGIVLSASDGEPASFAMVSIGEFDLKTICDIDGHFLFAKVPAGMRQIQVSCLGYSPKEQSVNVEKDTELIIKLSVTSVALPEFEVMAKRTKHDKIVVNEAALEYIQPTSLADVLLLLPGNVYKENDMSSFGQISSRQVGSDANTSLGIAVMTDGAPIVNDGMRTQLVGITDNSTSYSGDSEIRSRTGMNQGVDMRYISTDHIQSVEFTRGISSARYGNLSSGMIQVNSKYGVTPLRVRVKADLKNKLAYVGKGFRLSEKAGTLHVGSDFLHSIDDIREEMDKFSRITAQVYYNNQIKTADYQLHLDAKLNQTITVNKMKKDEMTYQYDESYKADYSRTNLLLKSSLTLNRTWIDEIEFMLSSDLVFDKISRHKFVITSSGGALNMPLAKEEGEHEGMFLPSMYYSDFYIDNIPVNFFTQLHTASRFQLSGPLSLHFQYGLEYRRSKNRGDGAVIKDETHPPFPQDNSYMRPRPNWQIPALSIGAAYLQADLLYGIDDYNLFKISLGGRATHMFNLPDNYALSKLVLTEPRVNASYTFGQGLKNTFRIGYGVENKLPTLDYLYPEKLYKDFYMLNAFTNKEEYRRLITYTNIFDMANTDIRENKNRKIEAGWDLEYKGLDISVTAFYEKTKSGFEYFTVYNPLTYTLYSTVKPGADISNRIPKKEDYLPEQYSLFTSSSRVMNSSKVIKKGVEYRIIFPRIAPLYTTIELNGAFYKTNYGSSLPEYYYPDKRVANKPYPYVGIYDTDPQNEYRRLNTNIWFNTHIPKCKLIFTNFIQLVWIASEQYKDSRTKYPYAYIDFSGTAHPVGTAEIEKINSDDIIFRQLKKTILPIGYARNSKPVSLLWNIKATKEFNKYAKLSFFVNGILDIHPKYLSGGKTTERDWTDPYFGVELFLNFSL